MILVGRWISEFCGIICGDLLRESLEIQTQSGGSVWGDGLPTLVNFEQAIKKLYKRKEVKCEEVSVYHCALCIFDKYTQSVYSSNVDIELGCNKQEAEIVN